MFNIMKVAYMWLICCAVLGMVSCSSGNSRTEPNVNPLNINAITAFALNGTAGVITGNSISVTVPYGTDVTDLVATFTTTGEYVTVGTGVIPVIQVSGVTKNNFENPVIYTVNAANGMTNGYTVVVSIAAPIYSYITERYNNAVVKCLVGLNGNLKDCVNSGAVGINLPAGIASNMGYIYVANQGIDMVVKCTINESSGVLSGCIDSGATGIREPNSIAFNESGTYAYIVNQVLSNTVSKCMVTENGSLSECANSGANGLSFPMNIVFNGQYAYITDLVLEEVIQCVVDLDGSLNSCNNSGAAGLAAPVAIVFNNSYAYITNYYSDDVIQCAVNTASGNLGNCVTSGNNVGFAKGMGFNPAGTVAYITNFESNTVTQCTVSFANGNLSGCINGGAANLNKPYGIILYQYGNGSSI